MAAVKGKKKGAPLSWVYLPVGLRAALPRWTLDAFRYAALDFLDEMSRGDRSEYRPANYEYHEERYGLIRLPKEPGFELIEGTPYTGPKRPRIWAQVREALKDANIIETEASLTSDATYQPDVSSMRYRLCQQWREAPLADRAAVPVKYREADARVTMSDGVAIAVPAWYARHLEVVGFDLAGAIAFMLSRAGATPATQDYAGLTDAVRTGQPPLWALEEAEAEREPDDFRPAAEIVTASVLATLAHVWRWRVDGRWSRRHTGPGYRDHRGHRLHSAITSLDGDLRRFLTLGGERLCCIDASNSQMVILAGALLAAHPLAEDALEFADVCANGRFYEESFKVAHCTDIDPTKAQRNLWKSQVMGRFLYCSQRVQMNAKQARLMAQRWPTLHRFMIEEKTGGSAELPCRMQRAEAAIWIDALAPELERAGIPGLTTHDALIFPESRAAEVEAIVRRLYWDAGLRAGFVVKPV